MGRGPCCSRNYTTSSGRAADSPRFSNAFSLPLNISRRVRTIKRIEIWFRVFPHFCRHVLCSQEQTEGRKNIAVTVGQRFCGLSQDANQRHCAASIRGCGESGGVGGLDGRGAAVTKPQRRASLEGASCQPASRLRARTCPLTDNQIRWFEILGMRWTSLF